MSEDREVFLRAQGRTFTSFQKDDEKEWRGPFFFIQGADPQFGLMKSWAIGQCDFGGDEWDEEIKLTEEAVEAINKMCPKPKFLALCGDLVHSMPGIEWKEAQERDLKTVLLKTNPEIPMVFVSGNHDIGNAPTPETIQTYCDNWGDDYFSFWVGGVFFLVLNTQLFFDASKCPEQKETQDKWLAEQLAVAKQRTCQRVIILQHIPLFLQNPDEDNNYFNLEKSLRQELLEMFHKAGVKAIFSGHYHRNAGGTYKDIDMVVTSAIGCQLGEDQHGFRVVVITEEKIVHRYYSLDQLKNQGLDEDLMDLMRKE
ncbi:serine/threonine-protein phosphatase CPPED1 [Phyllobates terribilis]|uniref:serine/threonine-protein phosphatase CPPED1 n=1 Tax=Phyllobates terribilis TaxID=111132 RepID=UPI003CCADF1A